VTTVSSHVSTHTSSHDSPHPVTPLLDSPDSRPSTPPPPRTTDRPGQTLLSRPDPNDPSHQTYTRYRLGPEHVAGIGPPLAQHTALPAYCAACAPLRFAFLATSALSSVRATRQQAEVTLDDAPGWCKGSRMVQRLQLYPVRGRRSTVPSAGSARASSGSWIQFPGDTGKEII
jgi:hypothetical protein